MVSNRRVYGREILISIENWILFSSRQIKKCEEFRSHILLDFLSEKPLASDVLTLRSKYVVKIIISPFFYLSGALSPSQFPVFTLYAQKICVRASRSRCSRSWIFDRVTGYKLEGFTKKSRQYRSREDCMASCLGTTHIFCKHKR